jgi:hypothetical protein
MNTKVEIMVTKGDAAARPVATVFVDPAAPIGAVGATIQKSLTRNVDLLKRLGLKACPACISGFDFDIRQRFEEVIQVDLEKAGV